VAKIAAIGVDESPLHGLTIALDVTDARLDYKPPLPPGEGLSGHVAIRDYALEVRDIAGTAGGLTVSDGRIVMPSLDGGQGLAVTLPVTGPLSRALAIAAEPSLGLGAVADLARRGAEAEASGTLELGLARFVGITRDDVGVGLAAELDQLVVPAVAPGLAVTGGAAKVTLDGATATVAGDIALNGVAVSATWTASLAGGGGWRARLAGTLDDAARAALGIDLGPRIAGPLGGELAIEETDGGTRYVVGADATQAALDLHEVPWAKPAGAPARLDAAWTEAADGSVVVESLRFEAPDASLDGAGAIDAGGANARFEARRLRLGRNDLAGTLALGPDGYDIAFDAAEIDLSPYMEDLTGEDEGEPLPDFRLTGTVDRLFLRPEIALAGVTVKANVAGDRWMGLDFRGAMPGGAALTIAISPGEGARTFGLAAADAGDALRLFDVFDTASGGRLEIGAVIDDRDPQRPARGRLVLHEFTIRDAPILGTLLSLGSFAGIGAMLSGEGIPFKKADVPFEKRGGLVTITEGRAWGGAIGLNADGTIDLATDVLDLRGTLVPAYTINSVFGAVPLIGELLVGGEGEGLFAATYAVRGPRDDPEVLVNPLATLAPGFLRQIFEFDEGAAPGSEGEDAGDEPGTAEQIK